jgi:DNA-directed RNA polymerase
MLTDEMIAAQLSRENIAIDRGVQRFQDQQVAKAEREGLEHTDGVAKLLRGALPIVSKGIVEYLEAARTAKGRKPVGFKPIEMSDPDKLALIGLSTVFHELPNGGTVSAIAHQIGRRAQVELEAEAIQSKDKKRAKALKALAEKGASARTLEDRHDATVAGLDIDLGWSGSTRVLVGQLVLNVILKDLAEVFVTTKVKQKGPKGLHMIPAVEMTPAAVEMLLAMEDVAAFTRPVYTPMIAPPRPWTSITTGAYLDLRVSKTVPLVKTFSGEHRRLVREAIKDGSMQEVLEAVNAIQDTRFAIDQDILRLIKWAKDEGHQPGAKFPLPKGKTPEVPAKVDSAEWASWSQEKRTAVSRERVAKAIVSKSAKRSRITLDGDIAMAVELAEAEAFFVPHNLDFRGRVYAVPHFNHQRSDYMKALFRFADPLPLGASGGRWLRIHLANCGDFGKVSKKPFDVRTAWVEENRERIIACGKDPEAHVDYWSSADSPFCFLQACIEYARWSDEDFSENFLSSIAIAADGSCSGLQHYSALTRSAKEAHHVNLVPRDTVGDIYQITADVAVPSLERTVLRAQAYDDGSKERREGELCQIILNEGFGRGEVKRNVMTYFYGSGKFGMRDQHMEDTMRPIADEVAMGKREAHPYSVLTERTNKETNETRWEMDGGYSCAQVMAAHTYAAVVEVAPMADEAATWIQSVAALLAHEGRSMVWRTQTGLPVVQRYSEYVSKAVNLWLYDRSIKVPTGNDKTDAEGNALARIQLLIREAPTKRVEKKRMRSAASPNVIHSMDGAHLQRSVAMAKRQGISHFLMIHDSFGTHAGNMERFSDAIREAFIDCYATYCPLAELDAYARSVLSDESLEKLPAIPAKGDLDLNLIRESLYAFA